MFVNANFITALAVMLMAGLLCLRAEAAQLAPAVKPPVQSCDVYGPQSEILYSQDLQICADRGHAAAMEILGLVYWTQSTGGAETYLPEDVSNADLNKRGWMYLEGAAKMGNAGAANEIGLAYMDGLYGQDENFAQSIHWLNKADEAGDKFAPQNLAILYLNREHVTQNKEKALAYLTRSAQRGSVVSLWTMGSFHLSKNTPRDEMIAKQYFLAAAILGGGCARPSEICDDFKPLFEDSNALIAANKYVSEMSIAAC